VHVAVPEVEHVPPPGDAVAVYSGERATVQAGWGCPGHGGSGVARDGGDAAGLLRPGQYRHVTFGVAPVAEVAVAVVSQQ
jgi:hypothetical protein